MEGGAKKSLFFCLPKMSITSHIHRGSSWFCSLVWQYSSLFFHLQRFAEKMTTIGEMEHELLTFAAGGHVAMVQKCLDHPMIRTGINQILDSHGVSAIHKAAENGHASVLQFFGQQVTSKGTRLVDLDIATRSDGWTALHLAAGHGHLAAVQHLIQYGANVHVCDKYGRTPLHRASYKGHLAVIECLHLHGKIFILFILPPLICTNVCSHILMLPSPPILSSYICMYQVVHRFNVRIGTVTHPCTTPTTGVI